MSRKGASADVLDVWYAEDAVDMYTFVKKQLAATCASPVRFCSHLFSDLPPAKPAPDETPPAAVLVIISPEAVSYLCEHHTAGFTWLKVQPNRCAYLLWLEHASEGAEFCESHCGRFTAWNQWVALNFDSKATTQSSLQLLRGIISSDGTAATNCPTFSKPGSGEHTPGGGGNKKCGAFMVIPNQVMQGTSSATIVLDPGYNCTKPSAYLMRTRPKERIELMLTSLSRPGVYTFDVPESILGKYHVHLLDGTRSLGSRSFTVSCVTADFVYNLMNPMQVISEALGTSDRDKLDDSLSQAFNGYMPVDVADMQATLAIDGRPGDDPGETTIDREVPTLLHFACKYNLRNLLSKLIDSPGALKTCFIKNRSGETPQEIARSAGHEEAARMMEKFQELASNLQDTYGFIGCPAADYVQRDASMSYINALQDKNWSAGQYVYSTSSENNDYVKMLAYAGKAPSTIDECDYAEANLPDSFGVVKGDEEAEGDYIAPSELMPGPTQRKQPPPSPARRDAPDYSRVNAIATLPRSSQPPAPAVLPRQRPDIMAAVDPVVLVKAGDLRTQFDAQSVLLQTSVKNGELTQDEARKVFDDLHRKYKSIKGKSFTEKMAEFEKLNNSDSQSQGLVQKVQSQLAKVLTNRKQPGGTAVTATGGSESAVSVGESSAASGIGATSAGARHGSNKGANAVGQRSAAHGGATSSTKSSRSGQERGGSFEGRSGSSEDDSDASDSVDEPPPIPVRRQPSKAQTSHRPSQK